MQRIVVGVDGSKASEQALAWAGRLAAARGDELVMVHAQRRPYAEIPPAEAMRMLADRREVVEREWSVPATELGVTPRTIVDDDDARALVAKTAEQQDAALIVLGRAGAGGGPGFLHLGSVVEHAAHHVTRPLAVIPGEAERPVRRILLGVDGSPESDAAVRWCAGFARAVGAAVVAVTVAEPPAEWTPASSDENWRRSAERDMHRWVSPLTDAGIPVECVVVEELRPVDGLLRTADDTDADVVVIGTRGAGGFTGLRFGGVAMKILHRCELPLVLVPPDEN